MQQTYFIASRLQQSYNIVMTVPIGKFNRRFSFLDKSNQ